jgi:4-azaleucine resistance transporter AzlC
MKTKGDDRLTIFWGGARVAWPICLGYAPAGIAFGVVAQKAGLSPVEIGLMSLIVFAGSSQFIAVSMLSAGAGMASILLTTFTVNLRHLLMSSALSPYLGRTSKRWISIFAYGVTDESFAVNVSRFRSGNWDWRSALVVNHISNLAWIASTVLGGYAGEFIPSGSFGIDYALTGMLICLLASQLRDRYHFFVAAVSGVAALCISLIVPGNTYIIIASIIAATLGLLIGKKGTLGSTKGE